MRTYILAALLLTSSQELNPPTPTANPDLRGTLRGVVQLVGTTESTSGLDFYVILLGGGGRRFEGKTGPGGRFELRDLPAGRYQGHFDREGFLSRNGSLPIVSPQVVLSTDTPSADMVITAVKGAIVSGKVTDETGQPVVGKEITPLLIGYRDGKATLTPMGPTTTGPLSQDTVTTDDRGEFRFAWLISGEYYIRAGEATTRPQRGGQPGPVPLSNVARAAYFPGVLELQSAAKIALKPGQEAEGVNIRFPSRGGVKVTGTVENAVPSSVPAAAGARPGPPQRIDTYHMVRRSGLNDDGYLPARINVVGGDSSTNETKFEIVDVLPGVYELFSVFNVGSAGRIDHAGRTTIYVKDRDIDGVTVTIRPNTAIQGRIRWTDAPADATWTRLQVRLRPEDLPAGLAILGARGNASADATFVLPSVIAARYKVLVAGMPENTYVSELRWGGSSIYDTAMIEVTREDKPLEISLRSDGGTARGIVRNARGEGVAAANVVAIPQGARRGNPNLYTRALSGHDGSFSLTGLSPGDYKIFAWESLPRGEAEEVTDFVAPHETQGRAITLRPRTVSDGIQLPLIRSVAY